jgi:hypothetical protein
MSAAAVRELTPALIRGRRGSVSVIEEGELAPGLEGRLCHHVFSDGVNRRESTVVLTAVPEGMAFAPALVCRDRAELGGGAPAQLPAERWERTELESTVFNRRYRLLTLTGQNPVYVRELFSPALIAWLAHDVPEGFSFELNERHLVVAVPGHAEDAAEIERLCALAAEVSRRIRAEADEEGASLAALFDESAKLAEIEAALGKASFESPPPSVGAAMAGYRSAARWRPGVLLNGLMWGAVALAVVGCAVTVLTNPFYGLVAGVLAGWSAFGVGHLMAASRYSWGSASVSRLGLEAFLRGYASSRGLRRQDRWRFHSGYRHLPLPGFAGQVMAGPIPETEFDGLFVTLGDAAELRSRGVEVAYTIEVPMAAIAIVAEMEDVGEAAALRELELPGGYRVETAGATVAIWQPIAGNLLFEAAGFDRFRAAAGALLAQVGEHSEDAAMAPVGAR